MDKEENIKLDQSLIEDGKKLIEILDKSEIKPSSAIWFYLKDPKTWRLLIASTYFDHLEPQKSYMKFINKINDLKFTRLEISNISLLPSNDPLINLLKIAIRTDENSISGITFTSNTINGVFIDDAYIYRLF